MEKQPIGFSSAEILLPDFERVDGTRWAVVACDQYTSEPEYWDAVAATVGGAPSTFGMILPEVYLKDKDETERRTHSIRAAMEAAIRDCLQVYPDAMILLERTQSDGRVRRGIIGAVDLECYDYRKGTDALIRATEGTVVERIPPRVAIRRGAPLELPHVMLLIDDEKKTVIEPHLPAARARKPLYDFDLMAGGGHVRGVLLEKAEQEQVVGALSALASPARMKERYGADGLAPLLFAVGDGNHSLASAKAYYEEVKAALGAERAANHPARYALVEVVNLHDDALSFEPIYRVVFGCDPADVIRAFAAFAASQKGSAARQVVTCVAGVEKVVVPIETPLRQLAVATVQDFLTDYAKSHPSITVDYIHGEDSLEKLAAAPDAVGFLFDGMKKDDLFRTVIFDGALPRKTFSMGHAPDKRYYLECRKIK